MSVDSAEFSLIAAARYRSFWDGAAACASVQMCESGRPFEYPHALILARASDNAEF
jgi:hypothetical protein